MKLTSIFGRPSAELPATIEVDGHHVPLDVRRDPRARRTTLRADATQGVIRLTLPPRGSASEARRLIETHRDWIAARVARWPTATSFAPGARLPVEGRAVVVDWLADRPRTPALMDDRLLVGGPLDALPGRIERFLRARAKRLLEGETRELAAAIGREVSAVTIRDTASRWGSCSSRGGIAYSWRLVLAPPDIRRYVVAHEVAHLVHMNHGPAFWTLAGSLYGDDMTAARRWLKRHGASLHWIGRD